MSQGDINARSMVIILKKWSRILHMAIRLKCSYWIKSYWKRCKIID